MEHARLAELASVAWPTIRVDGFARYLDDQEAGRALLAEDEGETTGPRAAELFLACAIAAGHEAAVRLFDERYVVPLERTLVRMRLSPSELDEVKQRVREKLLARDERGRARIEDYAGRGKLEGLVQVVATREAIGLVRKSKREIPTDDDLAAPLVGTTDPGLEMLKRRTAEAFRVAFADAVRALEPKERNLLRLHLLGGLTLEHLASVNGVHRATIVRWLRDAREKVLVGTKKTLAGAMNIRADEVDSLMGLAESRLDVSLERFLVTQADE